MAKVTISLWHAQDEVSFEFMTSMGTPPQVSHVLVLDRPHTDELWEISAVTWKALHASEKARLEERLRAARLTVPEGMAPLSDFVPPDPRYQLAKELMDDDYKAASTELRSLTYGVVPDGFEQTIPGQGSAFRLEPGRTYEVVLLGRDFGSLVFARA